MAKEMTIRRIGNSSGLTISKDMLKRQRLADGDCVHIVETEQELLITPPRPGLRRRTMDVYEEGPKRIAVPSVSGLTRR